MILRIFIYNIFYFLFAAIYIPCAVMRGRWHQGLLFRLGNFSEDLKSVLGRENNIWVHAVSVGEVSAVISFIEKFREQRPECRFVLSTVTKTGYDFARTHLKKDVVLIFAPLDFSWIVRRYIDVIRPRLYVAAETELWPNLFTALFQKNIPIAIINGRISDKSYGNYRRWIFWLRPVLRRVTKFIMQSPLDAQRITDLGVDPARACVCGNLKFEAADPGGESRKKEDFGFLPEHKVFTAGSVHPGEFDIMVRVYQRLLSEYPGLRLILAPRHIERVPEIIKILTEKNLTPVLYSQRNGDFSGAERILVIDRVGVLKGLYAASDLVFIGKSFSVGGGQNMIEPVAFGKSTFIGSRTENFRDAVSLLTKAGALIVVQNEEDLFDQMKEVLSSGDKQQQIRKACEDVMARQKGALKKTIQEVSRLI